MISKTLLKLVDRAILPALLLLCAKVVGTVLANYYWHLAWDFTDTGITYFSQEDYVLANSYSSLLMFAVVFLGLVATIIKSRVFHEKVVSPRLSAKLASMGASSLIVTSYDLYSSALIWLSYGWLTTFVLAVSAYFHLNYSWVTLVALGLTGAATLLMVVDVERELKEGKQDGLFSSSQLVKTLDFKDLSLD